MDFLSGSSVAFGVIAVIVIAGVVLVSMFGQGPTVRDRLLSSSFLAPTLIIHYFLPYGLVVLAFFMDIMSQLPQASWSVLIAILLFGINYILGKYVKTSDVLVGDLCEIPGLKGFSSKFVPQSLLFVTTIVFYLASFVTNSIELTYGAQSSTFNVTQGVQATVSGVRGMSPSPSARAGATWGLAIGVVMFQLIGILTTPGCLTNMGIPFTEISLPAYGSALLAIGIGGVFGGALAYPIARSSIAQPTYSVSQQQQQIVIPGTITPASTQAKGPGFVRERFQLGAGLGEIPMPQTATQGETPIDIAKSSGAVTPGESSDQFVCEAYKNGQLVTSTLVG